MADHANLTGAGAVHPAWYIQSTDPGAVGAGKGWVDTSSGSGTTSTPYTLKKRNSTNSGWEVIGGLSGLSISSPIAGQSLVYNGTSWVNARPAGASLYTARFCI